MAEATLATLKITPEQFAIYSQIASDLATAQSRLELVLMAFLAGAGITKAHVKEVKDGVIVYSIPEVTKSP